MTSTVPNPAPAAAGKRNPHLFLLPEEAGGEPGLRGTRCRACGHVCQLTAHACPRCLSREVEPLTIGRTAHLLHHSVVHHPADGFAAPYVIARLVLPEGPRVFAPLLTARPQDLHAGCALRFVLTGPDERGAVGFAYEPAEEGTPAAPGGRS